MTRKAKAIDNLVACKLTDAAKEVGIINSTLPSYILIKSPASGETQAKNYFVTNKLGKAMDQKLVTENILCSVNYTTNIRAANLNNDLKGQPSKKTSLWVSGEDGVILRGYIADV